MSDSERPKPQYGEYSSGEELASAREKAGVDPTHLVPPAPRPDASTGSTGRPARPAPAPSASQRGPGSAPAQSSTFDRLVTVFLLAFGAVVTISGAASYLNLGATIQQLAHQFGNGEFHPTGLTAVMGMVILATQIVLWVVAAVWSFRRISNYKLAWWVPLLFGAISFIVMMVLLAAVLMADPAFMASLSKP